MKKFSACLISLIFLVCLTIPAFAVEQYNPSKYGKGNVGTSNRIWQNGYFQNLTGDGSGTVDDGFKKYIEIKTTTESLTAAKTGRIFSTKAATSITLGLPASVAGMEFTFVTESGSLYVLPYGTDQIMGLTGAAGRRALLQPYASITVFCATAGKWYVKGSYGTVTDGL